MRLRLWMAGLILLVTGGWSQLPEISPAAESGATWRPMNGSGLPPLNQLAINVIVAHPTHPQIVYVGTSVYYGEYGGIYRTVDGGLTWAPFNTGLPANASIDLMAISPDGSMLYARNASYVGMGFFRTPVSSIQSQPQWTRVELPTCCSSADSIYSIYVGSDFLYLGFYGNGVYKSGDSGNSWIHLIHSPQNTVHALAGTPADANLLYLAVVTPYNTTDGGETWNYLAGYRNEACDIGYVITMAIHPQNSDIVLSGDDSHCLMRTADGGATWKDVYVNVGVRRVLFDPANPSTAYLATAVNGLYHDGIMRSRDAGQTWGSYNDGLPSWDIRGFDVGPGESNQPSVLYAGTPYNGIYTTAPLAPPSIAVFLPVVIKP